MQSLLYSQIHDIAERVRTNPAIRFWDEDEDGNLLALGEEHIVRYLSDFLPAVGIFSLPDQDSKVYLSTNLSIALRIGSRQSMSNSSRL